MSARPYTPTMGMLRELNRAAHGLPAQDEVSRMRLVHRGLVRFGRPTFDGLNTWALLCARHLSHHEVVHGC